MMIVLLKRTKDINYYKRDREKYIRVLGGLLTLGICIVVLGSIWCWVLYSWSTPEVCLLYHLRPVRNVSRDFLSIAFDTGLLQTGHFYQKLRSSELQQRAAALGPAYLRVGGTAADCLVFDEGYENLVSDNTSDLLLDGGECSYEGLFCRKRPPQFTMSGKDWLEINKFAQNANLKLIFDLNVLLREGKRWNSTNAKELLEFSDRHGFPVVWQLGNEPNSFAHVFQTTVTGSQLAEDFIVLRNLLDSFPRYRQSPLVGPDVTRPKNLTKGSVLYLQNFLSSIDNHTVDAITWHQYYVNGRTATVSDFTDPETLNVLETQINAMKGVTRAFFPDTPMWLSETSSAYGGGARGLSDRFVAGFMWLDKLGVAARMGVDVVIRQSLLGGHYALLDDNTLEPRPDWWLSVLFKAFVGNTVLMGSSELPHGPVRLYYHCTDSRSLHLDLGAVTIYGMNLKSTQVEVPMPDIPPAHGLVGYKSAYILTAANGLTSRSVLLNNKTLKLNPDGSLPPFIPVHSSVSAPLVLPSYSMGFWVVHGLSIPACS